MSSDSDVYTMAGGNGDGVNGSMEENTCERAIPPVSESESEGEGRMLIVWEWER